MLGLIWRFLIAILDWRTFLRIIKGNVAVDVVFISNLRDDMDKKNYLGFREPKNGHFNGNRFWFGDISGRIRIINSTANEMFLPKGRKKAQKQFYSAVDWSYKNGASVILFAATTKRLFSKEQMDELKSDYPSILFTIGDNGTALTLIEDTMNAFEKSKLKKDSSKVLVLGPSGFLGGIMTKYMKRVGYNVIGLGTSKQRNGDVEQMFDMDVCMRFEDVGKVDSVLACTHSIDSLLDASTVDLVRMPEKKLLVIDVAEPKNLNKDEYKSCNDKVVLVHAGDPYSKRLKCVGGFLSYRMLRLPKNVIFGCFAEALVLAKAKKENVNTERINNADWFEVNDENMALTKELFNGSFSTNKPQCFSSAISSFNLRYLIPS